MATNSRLDLFPELDRDLVSYTKGILPAQRIADLIAGGHVVASEPITEAQIQPASLDLRLGAFAYQVRASFLPSRTSTILSQIRDLRGREIDLSSPTELKRGNVYLIPLLEEMHLPRGVSGKANPKSTIGRLDIFTRLVAEYVNEFERVPAGYQGKLYVEVVPRAFDVVVHTGSRLNQLRFTRGTGLRSDKRLTALHRREKIVYEGDGAPGRAEIKQGLWITVDLRGDGPAAVVGYRAKRSAPPVDLDRVDHYYPADFWERIESSGKHHMIIKPGDFYILASREKILVPPDYAAEMVAYDPSVGEFRVHYAGFFDPGFGYTRGDAKGTRAVLEVRSHEVPFLLRHGQRVGRLIYETLLETPSILYGATIGSSYGGQELALSKQFKKLQPLA